MAPKKEFEISDCQPIDLGKSSLDITKPTPTQTAVDPSAETIPTTRRKEQRTKEEEILDTYNDWQVALDKPRARRFFEVPNSFYTSDRESLQDTIAVARVKFAEVIKHDANLLQDLDNTTSYEIVKELLVLQVAKARKMDSEKRQKGGTKK